MSKYQGPVFHKKLQTERQVQPTSPREVNRTQKETTVKKNIPFYKKNDHQPTKEPTVSVKKPEKKTVSANEDRTSTPFKVSHVPPSYFRSHKKTAHKKDPVNYQLIFQKVAKTDDAFLLFEEYLSDFGKEQVENRTTAATLIPETEEQEAYQIAPQEEQTQPSVIEEVTEKESMSPLAEETPTESHAAVIETAETLPQEPIQATNDIVESVTEEPTQPKAIKKRGLSRSLAGMIQEEQDARLNKGRNIARYFGESLKDAKPEPKDESQPATISELIARSRRNQPSNQLENLLRENEEPFTRKELGEEKVLVAPEVVEEAPIETEPTILEQEEVQETVDTPEQMDQAEPQATEVVQEAEVIETQEAESMEEVEEQATAPIMEETSQPATITELLARARANYSAEDFETLFGEEDASSKTEPVQEVENTVVEPLESGRKEVNEDLAEPEIIEEFAEPSEAIHVESVSEESIDAEIITMESSAVEDETLDVEDIEATEELEETKEIEVIEEAEELEVLEEETALEAVETAPVPEKKVYLPYQFPSLDLLQEPVVFETNAIDDWVLDQAEALNETLEAFNVEAQVVGWTIGPAITQFELQLGRGVKVNKITNLADDLKLSLAAKDIRIEAPIPGKSTVGVEVPNRKSRPVMISEVIGSDEFKNSTSPLTIALGVNLGGKKVVTTIDKMPHGLIAGATGSGKSVFINSLLVSLLYKATPNEVKLILIDPKAVELAPYNGLPHLLSPVISEPKAANEALKWAVVEMEERYQKLAAAGVRNLEGFNKKAEAHGDYALKLPYIVIIIDELADLMMVASNEVQDSIARITQKARAAGIHLIVATQRPSVDVVTGTIKNNIPTRVAFMVSSQIDSRTILDTGGAEKLLGRGDMLFQGNGSSQPIRIQGTYVEDEIDDIVDFVKEQQEANYLFQSESLLARAEKIEEKDELLDEVLPFIVDQGTVSASSLQRKFRIGFNRASNLIDALESKNLISENKGSRPRDVFLTRSDYEEKFL